MRDYDREAAVMRRARTADEFSAEIFGKSN